MKNFFDDTKAYYVREGKKPLRQKGEDVRFKRRVDLEELEKMSLNPKHVLPEINGYKTIVSNYVLKFWQQHMKPQGFAIYMHLLSMAFGEKNHAFPSVPYLSDLTGMSERTVQKYIGELEDLGFVIVVESEDAITGKPDVNLYMLAHTTPFIPEELYKKLSPKLKKEHDKYLEKLEHRQILFESPNY